MKRDFRCRLYIMCLLVVFVVGCKVKRPDGVLPETTMENLLYDYHIAKAMSDNLPYNESYKKVLYTNAVFSKYGTTEAVFDSSMVWYTRNTEVLAKVYERVSKRLKAQQNSINHLIAIRDKKQMTSTPGDSIDVWAWQRMRRLTGMPIDNKLTFVLPSDSNFKKRDTLVWEVRYHFLERVKPDTTLYALMGMQIQFENDSIISETKRVTESGIQRIRLQSDTLGAIKEVKGFIYYPRKKTPHTLLTDDITLMRYHSNDTLPVLNDSLKTDSLKQDVVKEVVSKKTADTIEKADQQPQPRLTPEEMNRRRSNLQREVKPEQLEVEKHIQMEKREIRQERQMNQRRRPQ